MANAATNAAGRLMGDWNGSAGPEVDRTGVTLSVRLKVKIYGIWMVGYIGITVTSSRKPWARYTAIAESGPQSRRIAHWDCHSDCARMYRRWEWLWSFRAEVPQASSATLTGLGHTATGSGFGYSERTYRQW